MSKHILNFFRKLVLSVAFKALPMRSASLDEPEPVNNSLNPAADEWLFDASRSVSDHVDDLTNQMGLLSGTLGRLHAVVSSVATIAPMRAGSEAIVAFGGPIWSDDLLFDGQPRMDAAPSVRSDTLLFDDDMPVLIDDAVLFETAAQASL